MNKKKRIIIFSSIFIFLSFILVFFILGNDFKNKEDVDDVIYIANYGYMPKKEKYIELVTKEWKELGHNSKLVFEDWDCYDELPNDKYELFIYDGIVYKSLRDKDLLEKIEDIDTTYTFDWVTNLLEEDNDVYGVPFLLCSDFLIYNKANVDLSNCNLIEDINTTFTTQYKSMVLNYYLTTLLSLKKENVMLDIEKGNYSEEILDKLYILVDKMNIEDYKNSSSSTYIGKEQMNKGIYNSLYGFSEAIYSLKDIINDIDIKSISLMENSNNKAFYVDFISMKNGISNEEEKLYTELIEVMTSEELNYEYVYNDGDYLYLLSANKYVLNHLSNQNVIYNKLYSFVSLNTNRVLLYGPSYYDEFSVIKDDLKYIIEKYVTEKVSG